MPGCGNVVLSEIRIHPCSQSAAVAAVAAAAEGV